ncbi:aldehyde dehydrogenase family protein [Chelativorans salis]|uniref:Aldehyde dehydrogenase family protein n=1 Tax=Chelativorans salis TaxID=2978478 RepID=A0ABT2LY60_9HYPH|nr:aldehyde dehydrogenase family protein [Chelativorans sp. EGI FJ00035]MCT7378139.1 aldehyde dehydrogenase family protein [Chelativorans sp. EGI FJ00035]
MDTVVGPKFGRRGRNLSSRTRNQFEPSAGRAYPVSLHWKAARSSIGGDKGTCDATMTKLDFDMNAARMLIDGEIVESESGQRYDSYDPCTGEVMGSVPRGTAADIDQAVAAADRAQRAWAAFSMPERATYLKKLAAALRAHANAVLDIEVRDTGNTIAEMHHDVVNAANQLEYYAGLGYELKGRTIPASANNLHLTVREPYGVVGKIVPFNHPLMFAAAKMAAPLITGNTVVIKPADQSPLSACYLALLCKDIFPKGVVNIVTGLGPEAGDALVRHPKVKRIGFIGSVETGKLIQRRAAEVAVKNISLELGGKNPMIVFPDADLAKAADAAVRGMNFGWQGQSCGSTSRLFLHADIHDQVLAEVIDKVRARKIGNPWDPTAQVGPINNRAQYDKVVRFVETTITEGGKLETGGKRPAGPEYPEGGYWYEPTIFSGMRPDMTLAQKEVFGPVLAVFKWTDIDETIEVVNSLEYGLTGSVWSRDINTALKTARRIDSGVIWVNGVGSHFPAVPFGGKKNSGTGSEESYEDMLSYTEEKVINIILD